jgi:predicted glycosyltransferase
MEIWVDIINPSHVLFFNSLLDDFNSENFFITVRDRAETFGLVKAFGMNGIVIGRDYRDSFNKSLNMIWRTFQLFSKVKDFDYSISFENGMSVIISKLRGKKSILLCDNDLKFLQNGNFYQDLETRIKAMAKYIIVPKACYNAFNDYVKNKGNIISYNGFKEDIYLANFNPDTDFMDKIPFKDFIVLRPEALGSFYVKERISLVPDLLKFFTRENINVIYLPREKEDFDYAKEFDVYIPNDPLNGLDLCYYADVVLTGSGTMAREAACLGKPSVSFFPGKELLSVDKKLVEEKKMFHSRNPMEINEYVLSNKERNTNSLDLLRSKNVKKEVVKIIDRLIYEN